MVRRRLWFGAATLMALIVAKPAAGGSIQFTTGNVATDMPSNAPGVLTIVNHPLADGSADPSYYQQMQAPWMNAEGRIDGWAIKDLRISYDQASDKLTVGVDFYGVAGDPYGNALAGGPDAAHPESSGTQFNHLGLGQNTDATITVGIDLTNSGHPTLVAGIPSYNGTAQGPPIGTGTDGFTVNKVVDGYDPTSMGNLGRAYGASLNQFNGGLAFEPSAQHPGFEFTIDNLSKIPGFNLSNGIGISAFAGTSADISVGEDSVNYTHISFQS